MRRFRRLLNESDLLKLQNVTACRSCLHRCPIPE